MKRLDITAGQSWQVGRDRAGIPRLIDGGLHVDGRGFVGFVNDFELKGLDRIYWVKAHQTNAPRGWVGHRKENKWFWVVHGVVLIAVVKPDRWDFPSRDLPVHSHVLCGARPQVLHVPPGYCTNSLDLAGGSILLICSSGKIQDAKDDDFRFPAGQWRISQSS